MHPDIKFPVIFPVLCESAGINANSYRRCYALNEYYDVQYKYSHSCFFSRLN